VWDTQINYRYSSAADEAIADADEFNVEYEQDDEQKCRDCEYTWTTEDFEDGKGRVAFSYPCEGIKEGDVVCTMCHVKGFECNKCQAWIERDIEAYDNSIVKYDTNNPLVDKIFCQNCEPKCESDSDSDDGEDKEYRIEDIDFDNGKYCEETLLEEFGVEDRNEFHKSLIKETCSKTWFACDEEQLCHKISYETGWLINEFSCEQVCKSTTKPKDGVPEEKEKKYEVRLMRAIRTKGDNPEITGYFIVCQKTFADIEKVRFCFTEYIRFHKWHLINDEDDDLHIEFDDVTDECDPEMIEIWSMKDESDALE